MAIGLRRALISPRNLSLLLRTYSLHSPDHSHFASSPHLFNSSASYTSPNFPAINFIKDARRRFAQSRKSILLPIGQRLDILMLMEILEGDDDANIVEIVDIGSSIKATAVSLMEAAVDSLSRELSKLQTGTASAGMFNHMIVETGGLKMPLSRLAVVSVIDSNTLSVTPYDPNALKELESAIVSSALGLNPKVDGQRLIAPIPPLTKEHMQALCKVVTKSFEDVHQSIRRVRQKALDVIKKADSSFPKDGLENYVHELTKKFIKLAEDMCMAKEKEITCGLSWSNVSRVQLTTRDWDECSFWRATLERMIKTQQIGTVNSTQH